MFKVFIIFGGLKSRIDNLGENIGLYVRSSNANYPSNGSYAAIASLTGGDDQLASNLAKHCVLELPDKTGKKPKAPIDDEAVKNDEYRLYYQVILSYSKMTRKLGEVII